MDGRRHIVYGAEGFKGRINIGCTRAERNGRCGFSTESDRKRAAGGFAVN
jgi:hypothetical protein